MGIKPRAPIESRLTKQLVLNTRGISIRVAGGDPIESDHLVIEVEAKQLPLDQINALVAEQEPDSTVRRRMSLADALISAWDEWDTLEILNQMVDPTARGGWR